MFGTYIHIAAMAGLAVCAAGARAAPLPLYDPGAAYGTDFTTSISRNTTPCGSFAAPCRDLYAPAAARPVTLFGHDVEYGVTGSASAGISNHGHGGGLDVLAWLKAGDTTLSLGLSIDSFNLDGWKYPPPRR